MLKKSLYSASFFLDSWNFGFANVCCPVPCKTNIETLESNKDTRISYIGQHKWGIQWPKAFPGDGNNVHTWWWYSLFCDVDSILSCPTQTRYASRRYFRMLLRGDKRWDEKHADSYRDRRLLYCLLYSFLPFTSWSSSPSASCLLCKVWYFWWLSLCPLRLTSHRIT